MQNRTISKRGLHCIKHWGQYKTVLHCGPFRNGKTFVCMMALGLYCRDLQKAGVTGLKIGLAGRTAKIIKATMGDALAELFGNNFSYSKSLKDGKSKDAVLFGQYIWFCPLKDKTSEGGWRGQTFFGVVHDECTLCSEENFLFLLGRISGNYDRYNLPDWVKPMWYVGMCNPDVPTHHIKKKMDTGWFNKVYLWKESDALYPGAKEYYAQKKKEFANNSLFYDRYIKGLWVSAEGMVWPSFNYKKHVIEHKEYFESEEDIDYSGFERVVIGVDWGNKHNTSFVVLAYSDGVYVALRCLSYNQTAPSMLAFHLSKLIENIERTHKVDAIYVDGAGAGYNKELSDRNIVYELADKSHDKIPLVDSAFAKEELYILSNCTSLINCIYGYKFKENSVDDAINRVNDDECDALRYAYVSDKKKTSRG